jgi:hypothetical protein
LRTEFTCGAVRYSLIASRDSRREIQAAADDIQPDKTLWTSAAQKRAAMRHRMGATAKEIHAAGARGSM